MPSMSRLALAVNLVGRTPSARDIHSPERAAEKVRQRLTALVGIARSAIRLFRALSDSPVSPRYAARLGGQPFAVNARSSAFGWL